MIEGASLIELCGFANIAFKETERHPIEFGHVSKHDGTEWQVIFKTIENKDYCSDTLSGKMSQEEIENWVRSKCVEYKLGGAKIEKW
jgi:hypothetical protein